MSSTVTRLNPSAPEFYPNKLHTFQPQNHYYYYYHTSTPPTQFYFYYPTANKHYPFYPSFFDLKKDVAVEASIEGCDSNKDPSVGFRSRGRFEWRRKGEQKDQKLENKRLRKNHDRRRRRRRGQNYIRAFFNHHHHKNSNGGGFPLLPIRPDGDVTTVMIKNIPSKYTYVS